LGRKEPNFTLVSFFLFCVSLIDLFLI
jgi:hypothetical protein